MDHRATPSSRRRSVHARRPDLARAHCPGTYSWDFLGNAWRHDRRQRSARERRAAGARRGMWSGGLRWRKGAASTARAGTWYGTLPAPPCDRARCRTSAQAARRTRKRRDPRGSEFRSATGATNGCGPSNQRPRNAWFVDRVWLARRVALRSSVTCSQDRRLSARREQSVISTALRRGRLLATDWGAA
jgi:hypothetical protein